MNSADARNINSKKNLRSKRGSLIAEAAIVFPVVLIVLLIVIYILISLYIEASTSAREHMALRNEAGMQTEKVVRHESFANLAPEDKFGRKPFQESVEMTEGRRYLEKILLTDDSRVFVINEVRFIRRVDLINGIF